MIFFDNVVLELVGDLYVVFLVDELEGNKYALSRAAIPALSSFTLEHHVLVRDLPSEYAYREIFSSEEAARNLLNKISALLWEAEEKNYRIN